MRLTVVGCSGSVPGPAGPNSCYLVEHDGFRLLLDLGSGAFGALQRHADPATIGAVALSHLHPDHFLDLCPYVVHRRYATPGLPRLPVLGPPGTHDRLAAAYDPAVDPQLGALFDFAEVAPGEREVGPFRLRFARVAHPNVAFAIRVTAGGRSLTYSGDTAPTDALVELARDSDVFLCEASWPEEGTFPPGLHLTGREAGEHAARAGAGRLLVTHVPPWVDRDGVLAAARTAYPGAELVTQDATYEV